MWCRDQRVTACNMLLGSLPVPSLLYHPVGLPQVNYCYFFNSLLAANVGEVTICNFYSL